MKVLEMDQISWAARIGIDMTRCMKARLAVACMMLAGTLTAFGQSNPPAIDYVTYLPADFTAQIAADDSGYAYVAGVDSRSTTTVDYLTYLPVDEVDKIAADSSGYAYVAGKDQTGRIRCTSTFGNPALNSSLAYVLKLTPSGDGIVWTICASGNTSAVAADKAGGLYFAAAGTDASVVAKLRSEDGRLIYATSVPGVITSAIAVDSLGSAYVTGQARTGFRATPGAYQSTSPCTIGDSVCAPAFVAKLDPNGIISYSTYLGVNGKGNAIAVDGQGQAWVTGSTSVTGTIPANGSTDTFTSAFVMKLDSAGAKLPVSKIIPGAFYFHAPASAAGLDITVDAKGSAYVVGYTEMEVATTPGVVQPDRPVRVPQAIGYLQEFDTNGTLVLGTYFGNKEGDFLNTIAVDSSGKIYVDFATQDSDRCGAAPVWLKLTVLSPDASKILASSPLTTRVGSLAVNDDGTVYVGSTTSTFLFLTTMNAYLAEFSKGQSGFAGKIDFSRPGPQLRCAVNAASLQPGRSSAEPNGAVAPGEIVTFFGDNFPAQSDLSVTFDGTPAPVLYADQQQINAVVPFRENPSNGIATAIVNAGTNPIGGFKLPIAPASPGLFQLNGRLAALNEDGSVNSAGNPAKAGSVISLFATGAGAYNMPLADGSLGPLTPPFPSPVVGVSAQYFDARSTILTGQQMELLFVGQAPGLVAGVVQVNLRIPQSSAPGTAYIIVYFGNYPTSAYPGGIVQIR